MPAILEGTTEVKPEGDNLAKFLVINGDLRRKNADKIASFAKQTAPEPRAASSFTTSGTTRSSPRSPTNAPTWQGSRQAGVRVRPGVARRCPDRGRQPRQGIFADELGIYGNCVIVDHGMGLQSLYAPLVDRSQSRAGRREGAVARSQRDDRAGGRRPPALHHAGQRADGEPDRVVGFALDRGPHPAQAPAAGGAATTR